VPDKIKKPDSGTEREPLAAGVFDDPESRRNIVGLFDLLLKIDRRLNGQNNDESVASEKSPKP
jgi:hypothetical protein